MFCGRIPAWAGLAILAVSLSAGAQNSLPENANALVRTAVQNELSANLAPSARWRYLLAKTNASGSRETMIIETREGLVARLISLNGRPLTPDIEHNEQARLRQLQQDPHQWRSKLERQERDRDRVFRMVKAMPDALLFSYNGVRVGAFGKEAVLTFKPNPHYQPDSLETDMLHKMNGSLRIQTAETRLVRFDGALGDDVGVGLGLVGRVNKGGSLVLGQARIAPGSWEITTLDLKISGRALFKHLDLSVQETARDFRPVPADLTVAQAIDLLLRE